MRFNRPIIAEWTWIALNVAVLHVCCMSTNFRRSRFVSEHSLCHVRVNNTEAANCKPRGTATFPYIHGSDNTNVSVLYITCVCRCPITYAENRSWGVRTRTVRATMKRCPPVVLHDRPLELRVCFLSIDKRREKGEKILNNRQWTCPPLPRHHHIQPCSKPPDNTKDQTGSPQ